MQITRRGFYYNTTQATHDAVKNWFATTYAESVPVANRADDLKIINPSHKILLYKSGTDTYSPGPDETRYNAAADALGLDHELVWLHYDEPTVLTYNGVTYTFAAGDRVKVYFPYTNRFAHNFAGQAKDVHLAFYQSYMTQLTPGGRSWDGVFMDNTSYYMDSPGTVVSGGRVRECGFKIDSAAFRTWHWTTLRDFLVLQKASVSYRIAINCASYWSDDYLNYPCCHAAVQEFQGNPFKDFYPSPATLTARHLLADLKGVNIWLSATPSLGNPAVSYEEMQYSTLCEYLVFGQPHTSYHIQNGNGPTGPNWPDLLTSPAEAVVKATVGPRLGNVASSSSEVYQTGVDSVGKPYEIRIRTYERGAVLMRMLGDWDQLTSSVATVPRLGSMRLVGTDGSLSAPASIQMKNGGGAIFII